MEAWRFCCWSRGDGGGKRGATRYTEICRVCLCQISTRNDAIDTAVTPSEVWWQIEASDGQRHHLRCERCGQQGVAIHD
jgi:ribosomal protein S14